MTGYIKEPKKMLRVSEEADVFVAGGSCTGVFAAVRAARMGARVVLAERQNCLGGTATAALVNVWHSLKDTDYKEQVIAGLTEEIKQRLYSGGYAVLADDPSVAIRFDPNRLAYELDKLVKEEKIKVYLHTVCVGAICDGKKLSAAIIENKDGRSAVKAGFFIDATGDGDIAKYLGLCEYRHSFIQPSTPCFLMQGEISMEDIEKAVRGHGEEFGLANDFGWFCDIPGTEGITMQAQSHVFGADPASADGLTAIETEGRRIAYSLTELINKYGERHVSVAALSSLAGVRESRHFKTKLCANGKDLLLGRRYDDAVMNGTYRVDMHSGDGTVTMKYLWGDAFEISGTERHTLSWNWREKEGLSGNAPKYYQVPFDVLVQEEYDNFIAVGRMVNADEEAFGAIRVMVNLNQLGEAAGTAAVLSIDKNTKLQKISGKEVREALRKGGSAL